MTMADLVVLALQASIFLSVVALALHASVDDALYLLRRPQKLLPAILAMNVIMPFFAATLDGIFNMGVAIEVALVVLAVSPAPPILPNQATKVGASSAYTYGLLVAAAVLSIVMVPVTVTLIGRFFGRNLHVAPMAIAYVIAKTVLLPLAVGFVIRQVAPGLAARIARPLGHLALIVLVLGALAILFVSRHAIWSLFGSGAAAAIAAFSVVGLVVGHLLGGPAPGDRAFLALATSSRHPGVALAIAHATFPEARLVLAVVLMYLVINGVLGAVYKKWLHHDVPGSLAPG